MLTQLDIPAAVEACCDTDNLKILIPGDVLVGCQLQAEHQSCTHERQHTSSSHRGTVLLEECQSNGGVEITPFEI